MNAKVKRVFGFEIKNKKCSVDLADQAEPKNGFRPYGLRVPWESAGKNQRGLS